MSRGSADPAVRDAAKALEDPAVRRAFEALSQEYVARIVQLDFSSEKDDFIEREACRSLRTLHHMFSEIQQAIVDERMKEFNRNE